MTKQVQYEKNQTDDRIPVGISACILGQEVRYNGGHKLDRFIRDTLGQYFRFISVCPEFEIGLGVPRESLRLEQDSGESIPRLIAPKSGTDRTDAMLRYAQDRVSNLGDEEPCGFIVQKGSPSCGMERVKVYPVKGGSPRHNGLGLFTHTLMDLYPNLPVEEDGRLNDPGLRDNFIERVFAYRRLRSFFAGNWKPGDLVSFHTKEKFLLLSHSRTYYTKLGHLVAKCKKTDKDEVAKEYEALFLKGLKIKATPGKHTDVLQHLSGFLKKVLDQKDRAEIQEIIERYHNGFVPLIVPITLLKHHIYRNQIDYLANQTYLDPHPYELMLRNHV